MLPLHIVTKLPLTCTGGVLAQPVVKPVPRPSVSSTSATGQGSSNPALESEAVSAPPANEQDSSRPTDDQIIAQENEIRYVELGSK